MMLIAFSGRMGVGKSTAIERIGFRYNTAPVPRIVHLVKFAQPLYDMQEFIYRRISSVVTRPPNFVKDRKLLQWLGTDWGREMKQTLWVDLFKAEVEKILEVNPKAIIVCDDVRFDNEAEAIRAVGGAVVRITSSSTDSRTVARDGIAGHASEAGINPALVDYEVKNDGTVREFYGQIDSICANVEKREGESK